MSFDDEQLDQVLRSTLGGKTFEQKPHYWEGAQQLIDAHRKQRSRNMLYYSVSTAVVAVVASAWLLISNTASENELAFANVSPTTPNTTEQVTPAPQSFSSEMATTGDSQSEITPLESTVTPESNKTTTQSNSGTQQSQHRSTTSSRSTIPFQSGTQRTSQPEDVSDLAATPSRMQEPERIAYRRFVFAPQFGNGLSADTFNRKSFDQAYTQRKQQHLFLLEAGVNSYNGLSANIHGGIRYMRFVSPSMAVSVGATYAQLHQDLNRTYQDIDYTFGQQIQETQIQTKRIDYIELPVAVHYAINSKHLINLGCIPAYAIHSRDLVTLSSGESSSNNNGTYLDAINRFDLQLQAGYSFRVNETWMVSANYQFGLMDISNNNVFKTTNFDRNQGLRLTLGYKLF